MKKEKKATAGHSNFIDVYSVNEIVDNTGITTDIMAVICKAASESLFKDLIDNHDMSDGVKSILAEAAIKAGYIANILVFGMTPKEAYLAAIDELNEAGYELTGNK